MLLSNTRAASWPNLPPVPVTMKLMNGTSSYYIATLSNVPAGYDVAYGTYPNWCVDRRYTAIRNVSIEVVLNSSLNPPANIEPYWEMVNYILNHKQGNMADIQDAIWYFIKMGSLGWWSGATPSATSLAIVSEALAYGKGYVPHQGEFLAVVCYPSSTPTQITLIEIRIPQSPTAPVGGYSYSMEISNKTGRQVMPYLASIIILTAFLVKSKRKTD